MGILVEGQRREEELLAETDPAGGFQRSNSHFRNRITADGSSGFKAEADATISMSRTIVPGRTAR